MYHNNCCIALSHTCMHSAQLRPLSFCADSTKFFRSHSCTAMSTEGTVRRLHLSGLHPSISHKELETRLSMFGTVDAVFPSETSKLCANGASKTYAIVHLDATEQQYKKRELFCYC